MLEAKFMQLLRAEQISGIELIRKVRRFFCAGAERVLSQVEGSAGRGHAVRVLKDLREELEDLSKMPDREKGEELLSGEIYWLLIRQETRPRLAIFLPRLEETPPEKYPWVTLRPEVRYGWEDVTHIVGHVPRPLIDSDVKSEEAKSEPAKQVSA